MAFDPFGIQDYHDEIRVRIEADEPGYAQSLIGDVFVSYEAASFRGPVFFSSHLPLFLPIHSSALIDELIVDVARQEGLASRRTFRRTRVERMVEDRAAYPPTFTKMQQQAALLRDFYLRSGAKGAGILF